MKNIKIIIIATFMLVGMVSVSYSEGQYLTTSVKSGTLDVINKSDNTVVFNGINYRYKLNERISVLAIDESGIKPLKLSELRAGNSYYFETMTDVMDPKESDFKEIIYISDTKPEELE